MFDRFNGNALAAIQLVESLLDGLPKLQFIDGVIKRGVWRQFLRHLEENLFGTHRLPITNSIGATGLQLFSAPRTASSPGSACFRAHGVGQM